MGPTTWVPFKDWEDLSNIASEFLEAWASKTEFGSPMGKLEEACGEDSDEIAASIHNFSL